jgi:protein-tyrosine-phosphatase
MTKTRVLFLCTHNSARSQMAEGLLRHLAGDRYEVMSAGTEATSVRPEAIFAMSELGVDISGQTSKTMERYLGEPFDYVVTFCDDANEAALSSPARRTACTGRSGTLRGHREVTRSASRSSGQCGMRSRPASAMNYSQRIDRDGLLHRTSPPGRDTPDPRASRGGRPAAGRARNTPSAPSSLPRPARTPPAPRCWICEPARNWTRSRFTSPSPHPTLLSSSSCASLHHLPRTPPTCV